MKLFCVHDSKAQVYLNPMTFRNAGEAMRAWETTCKDPKTQFSQYPNDFTLLELGSYNVDTAKITCHPNPIILGNGADFSMQPHHA